MNKKQYSPYMQPVTVSGDDRGVFVQFLETAQSMINGITIKRLYYVYNYSTGVVRGFHYHRQEWKYFMVVNGAAKINAINPDLPQEVFSFVSSARKPTLVVIPPGFANGWVSLQDETVLVCASTSTLKESIKDDKRMDPYTWGDIWSVKGR